MEKYLYQFPLSTSNKKLKYLSHYIVYEWMKTKKGYSKTDVKKRLIFISSLEILIFIYILIYPELFFSNIFGICVVIFGIFIFIAGTQTLNLYYFYYKWVIFLTRLKKSAACKKVQFYDDYLQIVGLNKFNNVNYDNVRFFIYKDDVYILFTKNKSGFFFIIEQPTHSGEFLFFLKKHIKNNGFFSHRK